MDESVSQPRLVFLSLSVELGFVDTPQGETDGRDDSTLPSDLAN
jgi:hypothetical protein